ncbi:hypothetical protein [Shewanella sp. Isolate11]|uniref:hypothetical protein n=1 Tax=Shewanella sp. Isolate11 TaxID=2908530 RepID=UPI001EFEDF76|nr:hypothetical protein [Shewanella sp. Isolate11]MCG9697947.1 hypothetical protein [Shewanella sp. Isolate11]
MKKWLIVLCCSASVVASMLTSGMARSFIDLIAFISILALAWELHDSTKVKDKH